MAPPEDLWLDQDAGPVVRPYALIGGRTWPAGEALDVIAMIIAVRGVTPDPVGLQPEHLAALRLSALPISVADLAADLDLPLGVVQILLGDLRERSLITVHNPIPPARLPDPQILKEVVDGLRRL
ncbi:MAG TPA: DUF742 domain-containing protein [Streptosporangiaceae bacterium]|nr:DUF742 domain-containing protein [Streptosporangiaceae bacterium]